MPKAKAKPPLGSGERFKALAAKATAGGAEDPEAVAAAAGMKKHGKAKMAAMAKKGKKKKLRQEAAKMMRDEHKA